VVESEGLFTSPTGMPYVYGRGCTGGMKCWPPSAYGRGLEKEAQCGRQIVCYGCSFQRKDAAFFSNEEKKPNFMDDNALFDGNEFLYGVTRSYFWDSGGIRTRRRVP
jgi:hypothetical protein